MKNEPIEKLLAMGIVGLAGVVLIYISAYHFGGIYGLLFALGLTLRRKI